MAKLEQKENKDIRPPVVVILGHIDHGKSTLIDYIRKTNVTGTEAGGITQHASAYEIIHTSKDGQSKHITFLDTPGHAAFESMRTRCANVADIAALVVSAEDGFKPQTLKVFNYIRSVHYHILSSSLRSINLRPISSVPNRIWQKMKFMSKVTAAIHRSSSYQPRQVRVWKNFWI